MDQAPKSSSIDQTRRIDLNNNTNNKTKCSCTNISIMQLFHEMKQEFPKVPDHIVQQLVTDHCHNRRACIDQLRQAATSTTPTSTMYPSKSIHNNQTLRSPLPTAKRQPTTNQKMKGISGKFESTSSTSSQSDSTQFNSNDVDDGTNKNKLVRPNTLKLRRPPDPPSTAMMLSTSSATSSCSSTPNSITSLSKFNSNSVSSSASSLVSTSISSCQPPNNTMVDQQPINNPQQIHHNVTLDSSATKYSDSLNVQLNVTVSPVSHPPPIPPRPSKPTRHLSQLSVQPEPAFTSILEQKTSPTSAGGGTSVSSGSTGQRSYTSVNFTLRQPTSILPSPITPIDIQAGPSSLTYSSSSFDAKQGYQSHLKITVAGNGESCIQAVRTKQPSGNALPEVSQIDTTISVGTDTMSSDCEPIRITTNNKQKLPFNDRLMTDEELRRLIQKQLKQKELLETELSKEKEKLDMIRFDIITLSTPMISGCELQQLCDEISRLRFACERLASEIDIATAPPRSPASISSPRPRRPPPPIPTALRCLSLQQSPYHSNTLDNNNLYTPRLLPQQPPSYNDVMRESGRSGVVNSNANSLPNLIDDVNEEGEWSCSMCTFRNYPLLNQCEQCDMPRAQGISITHSSYRPLKRENNHYQSSSSNMSSHDSSSVASNIINDNTTNANGNNNIRDNIAQTTAALLTLK